MDHRLGATLDDYADDGILPCVGYVQALTNRGWMDAARGCDTAWLRACAANDALIDCVLAVRIVLDPDDRDPREQSVYRWQPGDLLIRWQETEPSRIIPPDAKPGYRYVSADEHRST